MRRFHRIAGWTVLGLVALAAAGLIVARLCFNAYLNSSEFRKKVADATSQALRADGDFLPMHLAGATIYSDGFYARGTDAAFFSQLRADQLRADFNWRGLFHKRWQIDELNVERLDVDIAERDSAGVHSNRPNEGRSERSGLSTGGVGSTDWQLDLRRATIRDTRLRWGGASVPSGALTGAALTFMPDGAAWLIDAQGGTLAQTGWPELRIEAARLRYRAPSLFITSSTLRGGEGSADVSGEIDFGRGADLQVKLDGVSVTPFLTEDWRARLTGKVFGDARVRAPLGSAETGAGIVVEGSIRLAEGRLEALPVLDQIATFTRTQRFRQLALSKASLDFQRDAARFAARNVVAESEGLTRVEGAFTITNGQIDGTFQVGVTPSSLQWIPGSQARVFTIARGGYLWTPVRLTGPVEHPSEDLTPRLVAAASGAVIEGVEGTVHDVRETTKGVLDLLLH